MQRVLIGGIAAGLVIGALVNTTAFLTIARSRDDQKDAPLSRRMAEIDQQILDLQTANRIQDGHIINTYLARMRAAQMELAAGRTEAARALAVSALTGMIGLYHDRCGGAQSFRVPAAHIPPELRQFFREGDAYSISGEVAGSDPPALSVRSNHERSC